MCSKKQRTRILLGGARRGNFGNEKLMSFMSEGLRGDPSKAPHGILRSSRNAKAPAEGSHAPRSPPFGSWTFTKLFRVLLTLMTTPPAYRQALGLGETHLIGAWQQEFCRGGGNWGMRGE